MWYHPECLKKALPALNMKRVIPEDCGGFNNLRSVDKKKLRDVFGTSDKANKTNSDADKGKGFVIITTCVSYNTF